MKKLLPLRFKDNYFTGIEVDIQKYFNEIFFNPIAKIISDHVGSFYNQKTTSIMSAIRSGRIQYVDGKFYGSFNATISKELKGIGANFSKKTATWNVARETLPFEIQTAVVSAGNRFQQMNLDIKLHIDNVIVVDAEFGATILKTMDKIDLDWRKTAKSLGILPDLTDGAFEKLAADYNDNINLSIKKWTDENITKLRDIVEDNAISGYRSTNLIKDIQDNWGVSKRKAKFLARQETSLFMSKFKEQRYADVGVTRYEWSTSNDERVREDHKELDGQIFSFSEPPVVDKKTGRRANPGEDFGCRCLAVPVVE